MFERFVAIDWSGARSGYARKLQIAECSGDGMVRLVEAKELLAATGDSARRVTRGSVLSWLERSAQNGAPTLVGFDFSFAPPFVDAGAYWPSSSVFTAREMWSWVSTIVRDEDFGAASLVEEVLPQHFYRGSSSGDKAPFLRFRACEKRFNAQGGRKTSSIFDAVGAAQVAKASFSGMRVLHRLSKQASIWPMMPRTSSLEAGLVVVEIYCRAFLRMAGGSGAKVRTLEGLQTSLDALGCRLLHVPEELDDDKSDALIASAGLRLIAGSQSYWEPDGLTDEVAHTEGWTFGVK